MSYRTLFDLQESWSVSDSHVDEELAQAEIEGELAALLSEVGSGTIRTSDADVYHVLNPKGITYWSREVLEHLQGICQPLRLRTFLIDEGGGTYAFICSNGVYVLHHQRGLVGRFEDIAAFFTYLFEGIRADANLFRSAPDADAIAQRLKQAETMPKLSPLTQLGAKTDAEFRPYNAHIAWKEGDLMMHPNEGRGIVVAVKTKMYIQVEFASGKKTLGHKGW